MKRSAWWMAFALAGCGVRAMPPPLPDVGHPGGPDATTHDVSVMTMDAREAGPIEPYPHADLTVELPYQGSEQTDDVTVTAHAGLVDVHLLIDTTASMDGEIDELQSALTDTLVLGLRSRIPSLTVGVSKFEDVPQDPWGAAGDLPFVLLQAQTDDLLKVAGAVQLLDAPLGFGGDRPEDWGEALFQVATGEGLDGVTSRLVPAFDPSAWPGSGTVGGVGFRTASTRVVVIATDAPAHVPSDYGNAVPHAHGVTAAVSALRGIDARVVSIISSPDVRPVMEPVAIQTGGVGVPGTTGCTTGIGGAVRSPVSGVCPLVYEVTPDGSGLSQSIVDAIATLLDSAVYAEVHGEAEGDTHGFVTAIEARTAEGAADPLPRDRLPDGAIDGVADTFTNVHAAARLAFRLHLRNTRLRATEFPQVFFVPVRILGDGAILSEVTVRVIVPEGPKFDGGLLHDGASDDVDEGGLDPDALPPP